MPTITLPNNWIPRPDQRPLWDYLENGGRHAEVIAHRRWGKDDVALHRTAVASFERVGNFWHMLPEYAQARKAIWDSVNARTGKRRIDEAFPQEIRKATNNTEMKIEFVNGSIWQVVGSDSYDKLVGTTPIGITYSEWALANPSARAYLRPIIAENNGWQIFITTPRGRNHAYKTFNAATKNTDAFAQIIDATQSPVFTPEQLANELDAYRHEFGSEYGEAIFNQEYMCSFDAANIGAILASSIATLERSGRINPEVEYDADGPGIIITGDIGHRDTAVFWFWQARIGGFALLKCISGWGMDADSWCEKIQSEMGDLKLGKIHLPHDARAKSFAAKHSAVEIFAKRLGIDKVTIIPRSNIPDRINAARKVIGKCEFNSEGCADGIEGLRAWAYDWNDDSKMFSQVPKHDWASHYGDGFSYGCQVMMEQLPPEKPEAAQFIDTSMTFMEIVKHNARLREEYD